MGIRDRRQEPDGAAHDQVRIVGQQLFAGEATRLTYATEEAKEGRDAFLEKRDKDYSRFPWHF